MSHSASRTLVIPPLQKKKKAYPSDVLNLTLVASIYFLFFRTLA
jgi:hypothetical protein